MSAAKKAAKAAPPEPATLHLYDDHVRAVKAVALAASKDTGWPLLAGLHIVSDGSHVTLEATDSYRLHRAVLALKVPAFDVVVSADWLTKALRDVKPPRARPAVVDLDSRRVTVSNDDELRSVALIDPGETGYPDVGSLLDKYDTAEHDPDIELGVNPRYFADVLKACDLFAGNSWSAAPTRFTVTGQVEPLRFDVHRGDDRFTGLLMPVRIA